MAEALFCTAPNVMVVSPGTPARTVAEFVAFAKANPGKLNYSSGGMGSSPHLSAELLKSMAGFDMTQVPYKGAAPAVMAVLSNEVNVMIGNLPPWSAHLKAGRAQALSVTTAKRHPSLPDVPALAESYPGFETEAWFGLLAPAGTPRPVVERINQLVNAALADPELRTRIAATGCDPAPISPDAVASRVQADITCWKKLADERQIRVDWHRHRHRFKAFKAAPFDGVTPATCGSEAGQQRIRHGIDCMLALRDALGPEARLMVDCHWRFDEARALQVLSALAPVRLHWFECPLPETVPHWPALKRLRVAARDQGVLLAAAETQIGCAGFQPLFDAGLYDVVMPDVKYCGGPWETHRIAQRSFDAGVMLSPHNPTGPIASLHSLYEAAVVPECDMIEMQFDESPLFDALVGGRHPPLVDGCFAVPTQAAWRVRPQAALCAEHPGRPVPAGVESLAAAAAEG